MYFIVNNWIILLAMDDGYRAWSLDTDPTLRGLGLWVHTVGSIRAKDHVCPRRRRDDHLLVYCLDGSGSLEQAQGAWHIAPGTLFAAFPDLPHAYWCHFELGWDIRFCHFHGPLAGQLLTACGLNAAAPTAQVGWQPALIAAFARLIDCLRQGTPASGHEASAACYALLATGHALLGSETQTPEWLRDALAEEPRDLDAMARRAGMSRHHFARRFRAHTGQTPWDYILRRRLERAKALLASSDLPIKAIARRCGFDDPDYFSRRFKQTYGSTPRRWRSGTDNH